MKNLSDINTIKEIMTRHGFNFSKSLGQNFIINPHICPRIAEEGGAGEGVCALEIGAGVGVLTAELAKRADKVVSIELDERLIPVLGETLEDFDNVTVINEDVLKADLQSIVKYNFGDKPFVVCANLPYYITKNKAFFNEKRFIFYYKFFMQKGLIVFLALSFHHIF